MSDSISIPSQTQSIVSNEAFESLIDLLASDGIDENPSTLPGDPARTQPDATLRDPSGKLDFDKIRLMFAAQNAGHRVPTAAEEDKYRVQSPALANEDGDSDDESHSHRTSSTVPSRSNSMSPKPTERAATAGHRRSSTFGNQPWAAIYENATAAKVEDVAPTLLHQPLSLDELNQALAGAHEEVRTLRLQYDALQALVSKPETRHQTKTTPSAVDTEKVALDNDDGRAETRDADSQAQPSAVVPPPLLPSDVAPEIVNLSENEAKRALSALARTLNLSMSAIGPIASLSNPVASMPPRQGLSPPNPTRQPDVASIARAVEFLDTVDELVWRRTSAPSGPRTLLPVFSEENIAALVARLELWERAVRRPSRA